MTDAASSKAFLQLAAKFPPGRRFATATERRPQGVGGQTASDPAPESLLQLEEGDAVGPKEVPLPERQALSSRSFTTGGHLAAKAAATATAGVLGDMLSSVESAAWVEGAAGAEPAAGVAAVTDRRDMVDWEAVRVAPMEEVSIMPDTPSQRLGSVTAEAVITGCISKGGLPSYILRPTEEGHPLTNSNLPYHSPSP